MSIRKILEEPYFLPVHKEALENSEAYIANNQSFRQTQKNYFYRNAMDFLRDNTIFGDYFEFGTHRARTFSMVLSINEFFPPQENSGFPRVLNNFFAFDSFQGLPAHEEKDSHEVWKEGALRTEKDDFLQLP